MSELTVCRICLTKDVKMYKYDRYQLKCFYEEITAFKIKERDGLPQWFCFECAAMLHKFHKFKEKCYSGQKALKCILSTGFITTETLSNMQRLRQSLQSSLQIITVNKQVKTFMIQSKTMVKKVSIKPKTQLNNPVLIDMYSDTNDKDKKQIDKEKIPMVVLENICVESEKMPIAIEKMFTDETDGPIIIEDRSDDDILPVNRSKESEIYNTINMEKKKENSKSKFKKTINKDKNTDVHVNKFQKSKRKKFLDLNHWKKFNLTEDEAEKEFKERAVDEKYLKANYKCSDCFRGFSQEDMLNRHVKLRHCNSLGPFECRFCRMRFKWKSRLQKHLKEHYMKYKCLRCELSFPVEQSAFQHDEFHNGVTRSCIHCGEVFRHLSSYYTHLRKHRSKYVCTLCGTSFLSEFGLYMHKKVKHIIMEPPKESEVSNTYCNLCDIRFETRKAFEEHLAESAMHAIDAEHETPAPLPLKWRKTPRRAPRKCTTCSMCGKNFSTYVAYTKHHVSEHPDIPLPLNPYKPSGRKICEICGISLAPVSLANHLNTHTREKRHTCPTCGLQLSSKSVLQRHCLTHTGERPFECSLCDRRFAQSSSMRLHHRTVHMKQPYPKRNKRKKTEDSQGTTHTLLSEYYKNNQDPDDNVTLDKWRSSVTAT